MFSSTYYGTFFCLQPAHPNNDLPVGPFGTPIPCVHCQLTTEEQEEDASHWTLLKDKSVTSDKAKSSEESDFFVTAGRHYQFSL